MLTIKHRSGFTIVELAVVIVIIGILAGLVGVSYGGWQKSIAEKEVRSELIAVSTAMNNQKNFGAGYPTSVPTTYKPGARVTVLYSEGTIATYCIDGYSTKITNITLFVREDGIVKRGTCAGGEVTDFPANGVLAATQISAGLNNTCALSLGKIYCWGANTNGQLGNGTTSASPSTTPIAVDMSGVLSGKTVTAITSGYAHNCALASGAVYCWGSNGSGQLGTGSSTPTQSSVPVAVSTAGVLSGKTVTSISAGRNVTCAVATDLAYCWGEDTYGQLGNDTTIASSNAPVAVNTAGVLSGRTVTRVDVGIEHVCAIANSAAYCWGANYDGRLGNGANTQSNVPVAVTLAVGVMAGHPVTQIDAGHYTTCATAEGRAYCWGENGYGQLGNNTPGADSNSGTDSNVPVAVSTAGVLSGKTVTSVSFNTQDGCALAGGQAFCWGRNSYGTNGNDTYNVSAVPVAVNTSGVLSGKTLTQIVSGANFNCGLASGSVYCWGANNQGTLGDGSTTGRSLPVKVSNP